MKTITQYQHSIEEINQLPKTEKGQALARLAELENELKYDIHALKTQFQGRALSNQNFGHKPGKERAEKEKHLNEEKTSRVKPYEEILLVVTEKLAKLA